MAAIHVATTTIIATLALLVAGYGAWLSTRNYRWQRKRDEERRRSDIEIEMSESLGLGDGPPVIDTTVALRHILTVRVINRGESSEFVYAISLHSERPSAITVPLRKGEGSVEVRPRDHVAFDFALTGRQGFAWDEPFRAVVRLADGQVFESGHGMLQAPPSHGVPQGIVDPDAVPDDQVIRISLQDFPPQS